MTWGLTPRQVANQLVRCFRAEADLLRLLGGWTARVTESEERLALARDLGFRAEHGRALLDRLGRLRTTERMIHVPDAGWRRLIELIDDAPDTASFVAAVYGVVGTELVSAYEGLLADCDPLGDELTIRMLSRAILPDHRERNSWAERHWSGASCRGAIRFSAETSWATSSSTWTGRPACAAASVAPRPTPRRRGCCGWRLRARCLRRPCRTSSVQRRKVT